MLLDRPVVVEATNQQLLNFEHVVVELAQGIDQHVEGEGITGAEIHPAARPLLLIFHRAHVVHQGWQGAGSSLVAVGHPAQLRALLVGLEVFGVEAPQLAQVKPTIEGGFQVAALTRTHRVGETHPDPAVEGIEFAETHLHGGLAATENWLNQTRPPACWGDA